MPYWDGKVKNKYGAKRKEYGGRSYHSKLEAGEAAELDLLVKAKEIKTWKPQHKIDIKVNGIHITNYYVDFMIEHFDGKIEFREVKGFETDLWRIKWRLMEAIYGEDERYILRIVR